MADVTTSKVSLYLPDAPTTEIRVLCNSVTISGKKSIDASPSANIDGPVKVQTQSFENLGINLQGVHFSDGTIDFKPSTSYTTLTYDNVLSLYTTKFDNTNPAYIEVTYGGKYNKTSKDGNVSVTQKTLKGSDGVTTKIPIILETFSVPIKVNDSRNGYMPVGTLTFRETDVE